MSVIQGDKISIETYCIIKILEWPHEESIGMEVRSRKRMHSRSWDWMGEFAEFSTTNRLTPQELARRSSKKGKHELIFG